MPGGRPVAFTKARRARYLKLRATRLHLTKRQCAEGAGVTTGTVSEWVALGEGSPHKGRECSAARKAEAAEFASKLKEVEEKREAELLDVALQQVLAACTTSSKEITTREVMTDKGEVIKLRTVKRKPPEWTPAAWLLERRDPARFGRRDPEAARLEREAAEARARMEGGVDGLAEVLRGLTPEARAILRQQLDEADEE